MYHLRTRTILTMVRPGDRTSILTMVRLPTNRDNTSDRTSVSAPINYVRVSIADSEQRCSK